MHRVPRDMSASNEFVMHLDLNGFKFVNHSNKKEQSRPAFAHSRSTFFEQELYIYLNPPYIFTLVQKVKHRVYKIHVF